MAEVFQCATEAETRSVAAHLLPRLRAGGVVLLHGELGAGKTTFVRGLLEAMGHEGPVRSPTFNLIQTFATDPPIMHADLYRVSSHEGIGLEDYLDTHLCLIEWPDRAASLIHPRLAWQVEIEFDGSGRRLTVVPPAT
jgi:tRNA threonylcarbamoyladenosine biosynthesis protein TsaE